MGALSQFQGRILRFRCERSPAIRVPRWGHASWKASWKDGLVSEDQGSVIVLHPEEHEGRARRGIRAVRDRARRVGTAISEEPAHRFLPLCMVATAVGFNLWVLRAEILPVRQLNDGSVHQAMIQWALDRINGGSRLSSSVHRCSTTTRASRTR
jgi:hypothetical protein